jgi:hypothetical protein
MGSFLHKICEDSGLSGPRGGVGCGEAVETVHLRPILFIIPHFAAFPATGFPVLSVFN